MKHIGTVRTNLFEQLAEKFDNFKIKLEEIRNKLDSK